MIKSNTNARVSDSFQTSSPKLTSRTVTTKVPLRDSDSDIHTAMRKSPRYSSEVFEDFSMPDISSLETEYKDILNNSNQDKQNSSIGINSFENKTIDNLEVSDSEDDPEYSPSSSSSEDDDSYFDSEEENSSAPSSNDEYYKDTHIATAQDRTSFSLSDIESDQELLPTILQSFWILVKDSVLFVLNSIWSIFSFTLGQNIVLKGTVLGLLLSIAIYVFTTIGSSDIDIFEYSYTPPKNLDDLSSRLMSVESEISSLSRLKFNVKNSQEAINEIKQQVGMIMGRIASLSDSEVYNSQWANESAKELKKFEQALSMLETKLNEANESIENERMHHQYLDSELENNRNTMNSLESSIDRANKKIEYLKERVQSLEDIENLEKSVIDYLDKYLPSRLAVRLDPSTGQVSASPDFWKYISSQMALRGLNTNGDNLPNIDFSFDEFLRHNEDAVKSYLNEYVDHKIGSSKQDQSAVVSKEIFKNMLKQELEKVREDTVEQISKMDRRLKDEINSSKTYKKPNLEPGSNNTDTMINTLVRRAIEKYVSHTISKPDFVDPAAGAKIISAYTSPSYNWRDRLDFKSRYFYKILGTLGFGRMKVNRCTVAFNNDIGLGSCWPFTGHTGQVGVDLGRSILPSDVGIVHVQPEQSPNPSSAPRFVSLWVYLEDSTVRDKICSIVDQNTNKGYLKTSTPALPEQFVKIFTAEYKLDGDEFQVFPIPLAIVRLGIRTSKIVFKVEENWGNDDFTCIYRLRLFGESETINGGVEHVNNADIENAPIYYEQNENE